MARFVILRGGANYKVFDFEGNIARIGVGETMDVALEAAGYDGDLFFVTKTAKGYEIERRDDALSFSINATPMSSRTQLNDGDKITFLDYLIIVTYPGAKPEASSKIAEPEPVHHTPSSAPKDTAPLLSKLEPPAQPQPVPRPEPKPAAKGSERPTTIIDSAALSQGTARPPEPPRPAQPAPPRDAGTRPVVRQEPEPRQQAVEQAPKKQRITPVYTLVGLSGQYKGQVREIDTKEFVVGRDPSHCDLVIDRSEGGDLETSVSREHFTILSTDDGLFLVDKRSRLRTFINGKIIEPNQRESIAPEDILSIPVPSGEVKFRLCFAGNENFAPDKGKSRFLPIILGLVGLIIILLIAAIWLLETN